MDLKSIPQPFSRFAECPVCKSELHVCKMCGHRALRYVGGCSHDFADKVLVKNKANFCGHFKPSPRAYEGGADPGKKRAQQELRTLFEGRGETPEQSDSEAPESEADSAKKRLNDLFDK
ncbi:MAG: hypothetical protein MAG794_01508 [Gammaproteobacteria bacterium]|nr:hypothetical protein [Gammaproteobacteria bacterium]